MSSIAIWAKIPKRNAFGTFGPLGGLRLQLWQADLTLDGLNMLGRDPQGLDCALMPFVGSLRRLT